MIQIAVAGANGRMGQLILNAIEADKDCIVAAKLLRTQSNGLAELNAPIDVLIDFTTCAATLEHVAIARELGLKMVIGTTGFSPAEKAEIEDAANDIPIVFAPNMSIGINICFKVLELVSTALKKETPVKISDIHHQHKKDSPSGTALKMAEIIQNAQKSISLQSPVEIFSERIGETVGDHSALFLMDGETIEIKHKATDRSLFAKGAVEAAKWIIHQEPGLYSMQDVLGLRS
jgi:4-hydroxy-tetrahydrodipicolinate reductase